MNAADHSQRPSRVRLVVLAFACTLSLITYLDRVCIMRVQDDIKSHLGLSPEQMGLVFSAFLLGYALFEVPSGWMGDRWGARRVLTRVVLWWSLFTALTGLVNPFVFDSGWRVSLFGWVVPILFDSFLALLLVRFLFGCGEAGAYPNLTCVNGLWFPYRERAFAQGAVWMSARLGGAIAPFVIGRLSDAVGWQHAFGVLGLLGLAWTVLFWSWFRDHPRDMPQCNEAERRLIGEHTHASSHGSHAGVPWGRMLASLNLWAMCAVAACVSFGWYFYPTWQPVFLKEVHKISYKDSEIITGLPFLCGAAGCLLGGKLSDILVRRIGRRLGRSLLGCVGFTLAGLCVLGTGFVRTPEQAVFLLCLAFFINDLAIPVIWAVSSDVGGRHAGVVAGFMNMCGGIGAVVSPALTPHLLRLGVGRPATEQWQVVFTVLAGAWFVGALAWLGIDARKPLFDEPDTTAERREG